MMADNALKLGELGYSGDDHILPFQVEGLDVHGTIIPRPSRACSPRRLRLPSCSARR